MPKKSISFKPVFYLLFSYVIIQFVWWVYLIINLQKKIAELKVYSDQSLSVDLIEKEYYSKVWMVIGEGSVFLVLLILGAFFLKRSFNRELEFAEKQKNFLLSVTHELKTPITSLKLFLQSLQQKGPELLKHQSFLQNANSDVERLHGLVNNILLTAQIDNQNISLSKEELHILPLVNEIVSPFKNNEKHISITVDVSEETMIYADKFALFSIIGNLVENAIKYSDNNTKVRVFSIVSSDFTALCVSDEGVGIPFGERKKVMEKFYRIGGEETRKNKGTGLGLFIVDYLVRMQDGEVRINDNNPKGTIFEVLLPNRK